MKTEFGIISPLLLMLAFGVLTIQAQTKAVAPKPTVASVTRSKGQREVEQTLSKFITALNNLDMNALRDLFAEDATGFGRNADRARRASGRAGVTAGFQQLADDAQRLKWTGPPYQHVEPKDLQIQMLKDAAVVTFHLENEGSRKLGRRTLVLAKRGGAWKIIHLHASEIDLPNQ